MKIWSIAIMTLVFFSCGSEDTENKGVNIETSFENDTTQPETIVTPPNVLEVVPGGEHKEYHISGGLKIDGQYDLNSARTGLWISYYENGSKWSESYYVDGVQDGHSLTFYPNGKVRYIGEYKQGERIGEWKFYDEEGVVTKTEIFE